MMTPRLLASWAEVERTRVSLFDRFAEAEAAGATALRDQVVAETIAWGHLEEVLRPWRRYPPEARAAAQARGFVVHRGYPARRRPGRFGGGTRWAPRWWGLPVFAVVRREGGRWHRISEQDFTGHPADGGRPMRRRLAPACWCWCARVPAPAVVGVMNVERGTVRPFRGARR